MLQYFGNRDKVNMAISFLNNFGREGMAKALLITGPPGSGKTHLVDFITEKYNLEAVVLNASDERTKNSLTHVKNIAATQEGSPLIIVLDECDAMKDAQIVKLIEITKVPLFLTCNFVDDIDYKTRNMCQLLKIEPPQQWDFEEYMKTLCTKYNIVIDPEELKRRSKHAKSFRHAERLIDDPNDEDPESYEMEYKIVENMLRGKGVDHIDMDPKELNTRVFDVVGDGILASNVDIILEHSYLKDYHFWSYAYGMLNCARSTKAAEPITRTFKMMGEAKKKHKAEVTAESKAFEKATENVKVDVSKMNTTVVETGESLFGNVDLSDLGINIGSIGGEPQNITQDTQTNIGDWI